MSRVVIRKTGPQVSKANRNRIELDWSAANPEMVPKTSHFYLRGIVGTLLSIGCNNSDKRSVMAMRPMPVIIPVIPIKYCLLRCPSRLCSFVMLPA